MLLAGRYRLVRPLGRGAASEIWLADDASSSRRPALKFVRGDAYGERARALLQAEAAKAARLVHPNIVRLYGIHADGDRLFIAMQAIEGGNIGRLRGAGYRQILRALLPVADALEYAHRNGIVHRDLKADNVLTDGAGGCWLSDFGVAAALQATGPAAGLRGGGTPSAMSPQQLAGEPAAASDDIYAFGALLYDLLTGMPLFGSDPAPERIRSEAPVPPTTDLTGAALPEQLVRLIEALLQKLPARRPAGMGAVRAVIEDILADDDSAAGGIIAPVARGHTGRAAAGATVAPPAQRRRGGLPAWSVYAGLAALCLAALLVIFYLPAVVRERGPPLRPQPAEDPAPAVTAADGAAADVQRQLFEETLGEFLREDDELREAGAGKWGGADWAELRRLAEAGDRAARVRDFAAGLVEYRQALNLARSMRGRIPRVLADALRQGDAALDAANQAEAIRHFDMALAVDPGNATARRGRERAASLDRVLDLVGQAAAAEAAGQGSEALRLYREALALDSAWTPAAAAVRRLEQAASRDAYQLQMARGYAAMARGDLAAARDAFEAAARQRPGDADAKAALAQLESEQRLGRVAALQAEARAHEAGERWSEAVKSYEAALAIDPNLVSVQQGVARSRDRLDLDTRLRKELGNADRFNDDAVLASARALLERARRVANPGPALLRQAAELDRLLQAAVRPVRVTFESDNLTEVVIYKVGRLGAFSTTTLELRPGAYVAVGSRQGYRDVRRAFRVPADGAAVPVVVRCEEPI